MPDINVRCSHCGETLVRTLQSVNKNRSGRFYCKTCNRIKNITSNPKFIEQIDNKFVGRWFRRRTDSDNAQLWQCKSIDKYGIIGESNGKTDYFLASEVLWKDA